MGRRAVVEDSSSWQPTIKLDYPSDLVPLFISLWKLAATGLQQQESTQEGNVEKQRKGKEPKRRNRKDDYDTRLPIVDARIHRPRAKTSKPVPFKKNTFEYP
jgi:hypothetical protein